MASEILVNINTGSGNDLLPDGTKPLPEQPMHRHHHHHQSINQSINQPINQSIPGVGVGLV